MFEDLELGMELILGDLPEEPFRKAWESISDKLPEVKKIPNLSICAVMHGNEDKLPLEKLPKDVASAFRKRIKRTQTSFSYTTEGENLIFIRIDPELKFILKNNSALRGLLAHELMHSLQREKGLDEKLRKCFVDEFSKMSDLFAGLPYSKKALEKLYLSIGKISILVLKDFYANDELIKRSFTRELLEYYSNLIGLHDEYPIPKFHEIIEGELVTEKHLPEIEDALIFELELMPAWVPFEKVHRSLSLKIRDVIQNHFEQEISYIAGEFHDISVLYLSEFSDSDKFQKIYFKQVLDRVYAILAGVDEFSSHVDEALELLAEKKNHSEFKQMLIPLLNSYLIHLQTEESKKSLKTWAAKFLEKQDLELLSDNGNKVKLLQEPIRICLEESYDEISKTGKSEFLDLAFLISKAGTKISHNMNFFETSLTISKQYIKSKQKLLEEIRYLINLWG